MTVSRREIPGLAVALLAVSTSSARSQTAEATGTAKIKAIARAKILPGKLEEWKRLTAQAMQVVRTKDSGTLQHEIFFNEDESEAMVFERYRDADSALEHFANIGHLMEPLSATATVVGEVLGTPNARMRELLKMGGPKLYTPWMPPPE